ncbi:cyclin-dependent kinase 2-interacting protein isoform X1 [Sorex araneus]|uniref:cyclin-dependent kinase 2-interacting protein isoform X1 n=1 Tax=Sorex araneus TaxID=42254 RepID=UPI002433BE1A|nr:cyclin-dependent kinase 2-interacting protein isoform X1 [Sorex araneus]
MNVPRLQWSLLSKEPAKTLGSATPRKPVLSVSARKLKDNAADWHNLILKWETLNDKGFATANSIANLKLSLLDKDKIELEGGGPSYAENAETVFPEYSKELEVLCEELQATLDGLTKIQVKMEKLTSTTRGVCELENYHHGAEGTRPPMFDTWPTAQFYTVAHTLCAMYTKELLLKRAICEGLPHTSNRDLVLSFLSMWLHQPYLESDAVLQLEGMLLETGHRAS